MRFTIVGLALMALVNCSKSEFSGKNTAKPKGSEKSADSSAEPANEGQVGEEGSDGESDGKPDREVMDLKFTNTRLATTSQLGEGRVDITIRNMRSGDSDLTGTLSFHTVDFRNITSLEVAKEPSKDDAELVDQTLSILFDYKFVPEVTRYEGQIFDLQFKKESGDEWKRSLNYNITVTTPGSEPDAKATATFSGEEGHPKAVPAD
jgi:hypothetical protein